MMSANGFLPEWFGGNADVVRLLDDLSYVSHVWDDLIDKDKTVSADRINAAFERALIHIPANPVYLHFHAHLSPLMHAGIIGFVAANRMERSGDAHQIEIAHGLRYAVAHTGAFLVVAMNPRERAEEILPDLWKAMMPERFNDYFKEHTDVRIE